MFTPVTLPALSVTKTADEWRTVLVDPSAFQAELRAALAAQRAEDDTRTSNIAYAKTEYRVNGKAIARAAKRQNKKTAKRFLAPTETVEVACPHCDKSFATAAIRNRHVGRMHKGEFPNIAQTADDALRA